MFNLKEKFNLAETSLISSYKVLLVLYYKKSHVQINSGENLYSKFKEILKNANNFAKKNNAKFYFVYLPEYQRYNTNYNNSSYLLIKKILMG